jgi:DNA-binding NtrC family response regulator
VTKQILQRAGYAVYEAADGTTAELLHEQVAPVTLLLSDVVMPDMNGRELFERLSTRQPGLRCVLMSGYTDDDMLQRGVRTSELNFVSKPFTSQSLLDKVSRVVRGDVR